MDVDLEGRTTLVIPPIEDKEAGRVKFLSVHEMKLAWSRVGSGDNYKASLPLEVIYNDLKEKDNMKDALFFWNFLRVMDDEVKVSIAVRREFLEGFIDHPNEYISTVAMVEFLPTSIWRKLLWDNNIDFMSFESFLRRLKDGQRGAIEQAYNAVLSKFGISTSEILLPVDQCVQKHRWQNELCYRILFEELSPKERYMQKAAWVSNLFGMDFGSNRYPKGICNDFERDGTSHSYFLSIKDGQDDFVVRQEHGGVYWWLYQKVRSNYSWNRDVKVELEKHICPGFWLTMIAHFLFWIVSPVCLLVSFAVSYQQIEVVHSIFPYTVAILALITPAWIIIALINGFFRLVDSMIDDTLENKINFRVLQSIAIFIVLIFTGYIGDAWLLPLLGIVSGVIWNALDIFHEAHVLVYGGVINAIIVEVTMLGFIGYTAKFRVVEKKFPRFSDYPKYLLVVFSYVACLVLMTTYDEYAVDVFMVIIGLSSLVLELAETFKLFVLSIGFGWVWFLMACWI
ncbi:hypothetical protein ISS03_01135 [Patescibacteria group bacterium]|nr:hypothetical protein [Patescibacteria group bacterium]